MSRRDAPPTAALMLQASCVAFPENPADLEPPAILLLGPPGSGKSALALELIARGGVLVADDGVRLEPAPAGLVARPPEATAGMVEARGVGLLRTRHQPTALIRLVAALGPAETALEALAQAGLPSEPTTLGSIDADRLPPRRTLRLYGCEIPLILLAEVEKSAAVLAALCRGAMLCDPDAAVTPAPAAAATGTRARDGAGGAIEMSNASDAPPPAAPPARIVVVTGRSGAGRSTALNALEDLDFACVDTPPLDFVEPIAARALATGKRIAIGLDAKTDEFAPETYAETLSRLRDLAASDGGGAGVTVVFLDCSDDALRRRYVETRRRHPLAPRGSLDDGLRADRRATEPLREAADTVLDTSALTPSELRQAMRNRFAHGDAPDLTLHVLSFSYKRGLPPDADLVIDCRFLRNPHYAPHLRPLDGRDAAVAAYVADDPLYPRFFEHQLVQADLLLPAFRAEGKSYITWAFGCTGGRHRSVAIAEAFAAALTARGWRPQLRHREQAEKRVRPAASEPPA